MSDISIVVPSIRTHLLKRLYDSLVGSITPYSFDMIIVSPFDIDLSYMPNTSVIKSYDKVPVCLQLGSLAAQAPLLCHVVDDCVFFDTTLARCIDLYREKCTDKDAVGLTYKENTNKMSSDCWKVSNIGEFVHPCIDQSWKTFVQPIMSTRIYRQLGGVECCFEYSNHSHHDLAFRLQMNGGQIYHPDFIVSYAEHMPNRTGDHRPIHDSQTGVDEDLFKVMWSKPRNITIDLNNHLGQTGRWTRRFSKEYKSYSEMAVGENYSV